MSTPCVRCGSLFANLSALKKHLQRKKPCEAICADIPCVELLEQVEKQHEKMHSKDCEFCGKTLGSCNAKSRHRKNCKSNPVNEKKAEPSTSELLQHIKNLEEKMNSLSVTNNHTNIQNNYLIHLNAFGKESVSHIKLEDIVDIFRNKVPLANLSQLIRSVPENQNVYVDNLKSSTLHVFDGNRFVVRPTQQTLLIELKNLLTRAEVILKGNKLPIPRFKETEMLNLLVDIKEILNCQYDDYSLMPIIHEDQVQSRREAKTTMKCFKENMYSKRKVIKKHFEHINNQA